MDTGPCPMIVLFAKERDAKKFHDEKLVKTIEACPKLTEKVDVSKSRSGGNRWDHKSFPGGFLILAASNSPGNVKSTSSVGVVVVEEPDDTSDNVSDQGDAITLAVERMKRYPGKKMIVGGTPAVKGLSKTEQRLNESDCRVLPVVCHECGDSHVLDWENVVYDTDSDTAEEHEVYGKAQPDTAIYCCPHCGTPWDDYQRQKNIRDTVYNALVAGDENAGWVATKPFYGKAGFKDLSELYVCLPGTSLSDVVKAYLEAKYLSDRGDESKMIAFVNQKLGNTYEYKGDQADADTLRELAEDYPEKVVPRGALALTAGIDVQHDRLAVVIRAWGRNEESWLIYWGELSADSSTIDKKDAVWDDIDQLLFNGFDHQQFGKIGISGLTIDCSDGTSSDAVYHWVRTRAKKHKGVLVMAGKGSSDLARDPEIFTTPKQKIDHKNPKKTSKADRHGVLVYIVGTGKAKDLISKRLMGGSAFMHTTSQTRADYWDQVTAEVKAPHRSLRNRKVWQLRSGRRNEGGDCEVYAMHAARGLRLHMMTPSKWDQLEHELTQVDLFSAPVVDEKPEPQTETKQAGSAWVKPRTGGWLNRG
jgi:phage terminase large subunit GpA-like protein